MLSCPHCGRRPTAEFRYGGEVAPRPAVDAVLDPTGLADWLYGADNPKGGAREHWQHVAGCRAWFVLLRDTARDVVVEVLP